MPVPLPARPNLEWLRKTAKDRLAELRASGRTAQLADAQREIAREHGFASWRRLKTHVEQLDHTTPAAPPPTEEVLDVFFAHVGAGRLDDVRKMLTETPALVNAVGPHPFWGGRPQALHVAIETKRREMFDLLIAHGADVSGSNDQYDHWSPLMLAIDRNRPDMRDDLLARGARIGLPEALMLADDARVEELLRAGTLPDITPNGGSFLALARTPFAIDQLLALGARTDQRDRWGSTPIDAISRLGPRGRALVDHLTHHGIAAEPKEYARIGDVETLRRLIAADPTIARQDAVMMAAVDFRHHALVSWLLQQGANVNAHAEIGSRGSALHSAAWNGDLQMVELLVEAGADVNARDPEHHNTPKGWAEVATNVTNNPACAEVAAYLSEYRS